MKIRKRRTTRKFTFAYILYNCIRLVYIIYFLSRSSKNLLTRSQWSHLRLRSRTQGQSSWHQFHLARRRYRKVPVKCLTVHRGEVLQQVQLTLAVERLCASSKAHAPEDPSAPAQPRRPGVGAESVPKKNGVPGWPLHLGQQFFSLKMGRQYICGQIPLLKIAIVIASGVPLWSLHIRPRPSQSPLLVVVMCSMTTFRSGFSAIIGLRMVSMNTASLSKMSTTGSVSP